MQGLMNIEVSRVGIGDRFGKEGSAQLRAMQKAEQAGVVVVPVWNKSFREHSLIGTKPDDVRVEADAAVKARRLEAQLLRRRRPHRPQDRRRLPGRQQLLHPRRRRLHRQGGDRRGDRRLRARHGAVQGGAAHPRRRRRRSTSPTPCSRRSRATTFTRSRRRARSTATSSPPRAPTTSCPRSRPTRPTTRSSRSSCSSSWRAIAREKIPVQTIAPKFSGKFLKGIDYVGDIRTFEREFDADLAVVAHARQVFGLPASLKISVHTGSDKFSLYPIMHRAIKKHGAGLHLKTAGTNWLEEVIGIAQSGPKGLAIAKRIYAQAVRALRRAVQAVRDGRRDRPHVAADAGRGRRVDRRGVREGAAPRPVVRRVQRPPAAAGPRGVPGRRRDGRRVHSARSTTRARSPAAA